MAPPPHAPPPPSPRTRTLSSRAVAGIRGCDGRTKPHPSTTMTTLWTGSRHCAAPPSHLLPRHADAPCTDTRGGLRAPLIPGGGGCLRPPVPTAGVRPSRRGGGHGRRPHRPRPIHNRLGSRSEVRPGRHRQRRRSQTRLIHDLPHCSEPRAATTRRLHSVVVCPACGTSPPRVDADGFTEVCGRCSSRRHRQRRAQREQQILANALCIPAVFTRKCFRCLSTK